MSKPIFLTFDHDQYNYFLERENDLNQLQQQLHDHAMHVLGSYRVNWVKYLDDPVNYLVDTYWSEYCKDKPDHLNKKNHVVRESNMNTRAIERLNKEFKRVLGTCGKHKPKITKTGLKSTLKKDDFSLYLNPSKQKEYDATKKIMDGVKELSQFKTVYDANLMRVCADVFRIEQLKPVIHWHYFSI